MPGERLSMRIREVLRLRFGQGLSQRAIGQSLRLSVGAVNAYLSRSRMAGLGWPLPAEFDDAQLETLRATRPGSRLVPPTRRLRLDPPQPAFGDQRSNRGRQVLAGLRAGTQGLPGSFSVLYRRAPRLFAELAVARGEGRLPRMLAMLERTRLLIIDDWGPEPLAAEQRRDLLEIVDDRYEKGSLLVTSQAPVKRWHELMGDPTIGEAILDRVVHRPIASS
jgi:IstB-like ATP binding protein/Sigma-70, region 4